MSKQGELEENLRREQPLFTVIFSLKSASVFSLSLHYTITFDPLSLPMETPQKKKSHKGGTVVRTEPSDMHLFDAEPMVREVFQRVGCLSFFQNMQRGHPEVARQFSLHFDGLKTKVGDLEFEVSEASIAAATGIPNTGERWFKSMTLNVAFSKDFLKPDYQTDNLSKGVPRSHLVEYFDKMLKIIQRYLHVREGLICYTSTI
jgi:hypothetical protein